MNFTQVIRDVNIQIRLKGVNFNYLKSYLVYGLFCNNEKCINLFQSITFTSLSWAFSVVSIQDLSGGALMSHIRILLSIEQEAITVASFGDH